MKGITAVGIDLAKSVFFIVGVNRAERVVVSKELRRPKLMAFIEQLQPGTAIYMEACGSAHFWGRRFEAAGMTVRLIAGQHAKKFVDGNKDDAADALAIVTCGLRPKTRFVPLKTARQLEEQALHRVRSRLVKERTALANEIRGFLYEHGFILQKGIAKLREELAALLDELPALLREILEDLAEELRLKDERVKRYTSLIQRESKGSETVRRLETIPSVGPLIASAVVCEVGETGARQFKMGRDFAASLGLVPRHTGTGGKNINLSISKKGDKYIRTLLVQGAQSIMRHSANRGDPLSLWIEGVKKRRGHQKAAIALANKIARIVWRLLTTEGAVYQPNLAA